MASDSGWNPTPMTSPTQQFSETLQLPNAQLLNPRQAVKHSPLDMEQTPEGASLTEVSFTAIKPSIVTKFPPSISHSPIHTAQDSEKPGLLGDTVRSKTFADNAKALRDLQPQDDHIDGSISPGKPRRPSMLDTEPAIGRRSIQFVRPAFATEQGSGSHSRSRSWDHQDVEPKDKDRSGSSLFSKIRALATPSGPSTHARSPISLGGDSIDDRSPTSQGVHKFPRGTPSTPREGSEVDADSEQSSGEESARNSLPRKRRRKSRRPLDGGPQTAPATPKTPSRPGLLAPTSLFPSDRFRTTFLTRRATMADITSESQQGVSEDEGRERLSHSSPWRRGTAWVHGPRGMSFSEGRNSNHQAFAEERRPSNFRRFTGLGGPSDGTEASPFSQWKISRGERSERGPSISAAKWRQLKAGWKLIGPRRKAEITIDHAKSAELLAELTAGVPAALILASMFQRDEHGNRRIPILLEQLKVRFTDSKQVDSKSGDRHMIFRIELEYGNGLTRMKWVIHRALKDFANLHARYKLHIGAQKYIQLRPDDARTKLPHFPKSAFPYLRGIRGLDSDTEEDEDRDADGTGPSGGEASGLERPNKRKKRRPSANIIRRRSTGLSQAADDAVGAPARREPYPERQRKKLELYLQKMIRYLIFRPESNRLCKFLELSALGVRLAAEGSYHGKEGLMIIHSSKGVDSGKAWTPSFLTGRHAPKWFAVRHSYIVCVDSPEDMIIYDIFMVDSSFQIQTKKRLRDKKPEDIVQAAKETTSHPQNHTLKLYNSERKLKLLAKNERQLHQFEESIRFMAQNTIWAKPKRFDSFAPVRSNVSAQWLVDGRDYMWNVSRAISMAKDVIYIHGWWISPELYMRRPAAISQKWRLDRLLQRKAQEGVKIFVIMYRNINSAIPIDSEYTKFSLLDLHPNIFVQRSPNQIRQNTFFWAHHEKLCIIDHMVAFVGGIDLCFGRWDTPQHTVVDDKPTGFELSDAPKDADHCQLWPGKDYSNARVQDFYALDKPYEEMYDRSKVPRMPWHDISMQVVGQPARDLTRHFVQRWNYVLRQRKSTRPTPFLLPPPDFNPEDLQALGLDGTCEVQILRSTCWWSIGTPDKTEHSIMNAYIKMIEKSDHFVYIENQFFISSCAVEGTRIENHIGDALVERIIRAAQKGEDWRAVILIPLMPGFQNTVDSQDGTSVRLIMQCQFRSICRGDSSIFSRIRAEGVEPEDYISFYSLRSWGKIGPTKQLVTEQLYIHAKCMVVDDRIAIIGSANINERSMLGSRDSECAAVVRDTDMIWSTMNSEPYLVGRFPHTLRMHLMREHLGVDVDEVAEQEAGGGPDQWDRDMDAFHGEDETSRAEDQDHDLGRGSIQSKANKQDNLLAKPQGVSSLDHGINLEQPPHSDAVNKVKERSDPRVNDRLDHKRVLKSQGRDHVDGDRSSYVGENDTFSSDEVQFSTLKTADSSKRRTSNLRKSASPRRSQSVATEDFGNDTPPKPQFPRRTTEQLGLPMLSQLPALPDTDDTDIGGPCAHFKSTQETSGDVHPAVDGMRRPIVSKDCMRDPLNDSFFLDIWHTIAENNTKLFRNVFRCMPDNEVKTWKEYKEYVAYADRFTQLQGGEKSKERIQHETAGSSGPPGQINVPEKLQMFASSRDKTDDAAGKFETLGEKLVHKLDRKDPNHHPNVEMSKVEEWTEETSQAQAISLEQEHGSTVPATKQHGSPDREPALDEKAALRNTPDALKDFTPLKPTSTFDSSGLHVKPTPSPLEHSDTPNTNSTAQKRRRRATIRSSRREFRASDDVISRADAEILMKMTQGHLVVWPYDWLMKEEADGNWLYSIDGLAPLEIYN